MSFFSQAYQSVLSVQGRARQLTSAEGAEPSVSVLDGHKKVQVALKRIVRIDSIKKADFGSFGNVRSANLDEVVSRLRVGEDVTLTEPQVRSLQASPESRSLARALEGLIALRDSEGKRIHSGVRRNPGELDTVLRSAAAIGQEAARSNILLVVAGVAFNQPNPLFGPCFFRYTAMQKPDAYDDEADYVQEIIEHLLSAIIDFTHVWIIPRRGGLATSIQAHPAVADLSAYPEPPTRIMRSAA